MNARSALFDLYGDHLRARGGRAPVAALVRLLAPLGVAAPAVRTAVSRMVRQGWLEPVRLPEGPGYALSPRAVRRLDDSAARIYRTQDASWDGTWHLMVTDLPGERSRRDRLRAGLTFLGYAQLDDATWIGARWSEEVDGLLEVEGLRAERFAARHDGDSLGLVRRAWDVEGLARSYTPVAGRRGDARSRRPGPTPTTSRRSPPGHGWCTSGASSCSWTRVCPASCCRKTGRATRQPSSSTPRASGCGPGAARFVDQNLTNPA